MRAVRPILGSATPSTRSIWPVIPACRISATSFWAATSLQILGNGRLPDDGDDALEVLNDGTLGGAAGLLDEHADTAASAATTTRIPVRTSTTVTPEHAERPTARGRRAFGKTDHRPPESFSRRAASCSSLASVPPDLAGVSLLVEE